MTVQDTADQERQEPTLLFDAPIEDPEELIAAVKSRAYHSVDAQTPVCRFRGTLVRRRGEGLSVVGWQRNVARLQKVDVSYITIVRLELDGQREITDASLDDCYTGSKGFLCHHPYLDRTLRQELIGTRMDEGFFRKTRVDVLHCFHLVEVVGAIVSCVELLDAQQLAYLSEDEVIDSYSRGSDLITVGSHRFSLLPRPIDYHFVMERVLERVKFDEKGAIYSLEPFGVRFFLAGEELVRTQIAGSKPVPVCMRIKTFALESLTKLKGLILEKVKENSFMCSNLFPQALIGLLVQVLAMKMYHNNVNYVLHSLKGIQKFNNVPRCIGGIESLDEAAEYFPDFNMAEIFEKESV